MPSLEVLVACWTEGLEGPLVQKLPNDAAVEAEARREEGVPPLSSGLRIGVLGIMAAPTSEPVSTMAGSWYSWPSLDAGLPPLPRLTRVVG